MFRGRRTGALMILVMGGVFLAGCGSSSSPTPPTAVVPTPAPTPEPTPTPEPPPEPLPETPELTTVAEVLAGTTPHEVMLEGRNIRETSDNDELVFTDGTGEVVVDYPSCCIPALDVLIRVVGTVASSEIDAVAWEPL